MKERHFTRKIDWTSDQISQQMLHLRLKKMMINPLLRYCSLIVFGSYLLTIVAAFHLCNQIGITWVTSCFLVFFVLLFAALLLMQDHYSERRAERKNIDYKRSSPEILSRNHLKTAKIYVTILAGLTVIALLLLSRDIVLHQALALILLCITGTALYILTLLMIRKLLIGKLILMQTLGSAAILFCTAKN